MMRRLAVLATAFAGVSVASAQMPPSISKPIEQARKAADATNAHTAAVTQQPPAKPAAPQSSAKPAAKSSVKSSAKGASVAADSSKITFEREVFTYVPREVDPFSSPIETGALRPLVADLKVVGIIYDPSGRNSVVVMRDMSTQQQYRARQGQLLGRARVAQIRPQEIVLSIEEYGFSRQETLKLNTQQTKGKP